LITRSLRQETHLIASENASRYSGVRELSYGSRLLVVLWTAGPTSMASSSENGGWTTMSIDRIAHWPTCLWLRLPMRLGKQNQP